MEAQAEAKAKDEHDLWYEGRQYLFNERREKEEAEKVANEEKEEEERQRKAEEYIEQYYGKDYYQELEKYPVNTDQRYFTLQKFTGVIPNKRLALVNYVNIKLIWEKIEEILRADLKELNQIKDINLANILHDHWNVF